MVELLEKAQTHEPKEQIAGRFVGILVFLTGIAMLVAAFVLAYHGFHHPDMIVPQELLQRKPPATLLEVGVPILLRLVLLFAMGYIGSLIAARGAQLFFTAKKEGRARAAGD